MKTIVYPGTFDPITNGHVDLIERASKLFDKIMYRYRQQSEKKPAVYDIDERIAASPSSHCSTYRITLKLLGLVTCLQISP